VKKLLRLLRRIWNIDKDEGVQKVWLIGMGVMIGLGALWMIAIVITNGRFSF
jgi:hypothetical protein